MTRTRFAPSPTGYLHIGSLRTALYCYLWAKNQQGQYILRIEDTDQTRYVEGSVENLISVLSRCGINHDEGPILTEDIVTQKGAYGPYFQSERLDIYRKYIDQLITEQKAYYCFCTKDRLDALREEQTAAGMTPKYDSKCSTLTAEQVQQKLDAGESYVVRMKLPADHDVVFDDIVYGRVTINTNDMDEQVLLKADGFPTYHFAVVVDDHLMEITHVIRGEEWLVSTPKHVLLYDAFEWTAPQFVHLPTVLNQNKKKLSKRDGSAAVEDFLQKGYLPQALINFITLLGWSHPEGTEILSLEESAAAFDLSRINKSGAVFDVEKLNWMNAQYIKGMSSEDLCKTMLPYLNQSSIQSLTDAQTAYLAECIRDRIDYFAQAQDEASNILAPYDIGDSEDVKAALAFDTNEELIDVLINEIQELNELTPETINPIFKKLQKEIGIKGKPLYMGTRVVVTGQVHGPDIKLIMCIIGKEEVLKRLNDAKELIG